MARPSALCALPAGDASRGVGLERAVTARDVRDVRDVRAAVARSAFVRERARPHARFDVASPALAR